MLSNSSHRNNLSSIYYENQSQRFQEQNQRKEVSYLDNSSFPESIRVYNNGINCSEQSNLKWNVKSNSLMLSSLKKVPKPKQELNFDSLCKLHLQKLIIK